jgi:uncharacterized cupredoxin-like copper-binding protein
MSTVHAQGPSSATVTVDANGIRIDNQTVSVRAGTTVMFTIRNDDNQAHKVTMALSEAAPSTNPHYRPRATAVSPVRRGSETITVASRDSEDITLSVRPASHFGFATRDPWKTRFDMGMTYKYTIYTERADGTKDLLDPDIEVRP